MAVRWHAWIPLSDGRRARIIASMGPAPPARVDVEERPGSLVVTLFERRRLRSTPDGMVYDRLLIGITAAFEIVLPTALQGRRLIDSVTGFDPNTVKPDWRRDPAKVNAAGGTEPRVEVPVGRAFDWKALTGRPWFDPGTSDHEATPPWAEGRFVSAARDTPERDH